MIVIFIVRMKIINFNETLAGIKFRGPSLSARGLGEVKRFPPRMVQAGFTV